MMEVINDGRHEMRFFRKNKEKCKQICDLYVATKTVTAQGVVNQHKCNTCNKYINPAGSSSLRGQKICKCCGSLLVYIKSISEDPEPIETNRKSIPIHFTKPNTGKKTFAELIKFIEEEIHLQANYQLVTLKFLVNHKIANKGQIAEELAFQNNKDTSEIEEIKKFFYVPVYDVLEKRGFIKKITHNEVSEYMINVVLTDFQTIQTNEILEKKITEYNLEHGIPENQFFATGINWNDYTYLLKQEEMTSKKEDVEK